jgi:hypothetical protein
MDVEMNPKPKAMLEILNKRRIEPIARYFGSLGSARMINAAAEKISIAIKA